MVTWYIDIHILFGCNIRQNKDANDVGIREWNEIRICFRKMHIGREKICNIDYNVSAEHVPIFSQSSLNCGNKWCFVDHWYLGNNIYNVSTSFVLCMIYIMSGDFQRMFKLTSNVCRNWNRAIMRSLDEVFLLLAWTSCYTNKSSWDTVTHMCCHCNIPLFSSVHNGNQWNWFAGTCHVSPGYIRTGVW